MNEIARLIELARDGDVEAYARVVRQLQRAAIGYAYSRLGDYQLAEDVSQEAFVDAHTNLDRLRDPASFPGWLRRILATHCARLQRRREVPTVALENGLQVLDPTPGPDEQLGATQSAHNIRRTFTCLSEEQRAVVSLFYYAEMSQRDIGNFLHMPLHTVKNRLFAARKQLKEIITMVENDSRNRSPRALTGKVIQNVWQRSAFSTLIGTLDAALSTVTDEWPSWRLAGVLGHAFAFGMDADGGRVHQTANLDWSEFFMRLPALDRECRIFQGSLNGANKKPESELATLKQQAWQAVAASITEGAPAIAWQPMTCEQRDAGVAAYEWQLLVGCDLRERSYTVRLDRDDEYRVGYQEFGHTDPVGWFCVIVIGDEKPTNRHQAEVESIQHAVAAANAGCGYGKSFPNPLKAYGLAAYDLWRTSLEQEREGPAAGRFHAGFLCRSRDMAARYVADLAERYPEAPTLRAASSAYQSEARDAGLLSVLLSDARGDVDATNRRRFVEVFDAVAESEREAVGHLETALGVLAG